MIIIAGRITIHPDHVHGLHADLALLTGPTREEDGCLDYSFVIEDAAAGTIIAFERWRDEAAVKAHLANPAVQAIGERWGDKILGGPKLYDALNEREVGDWRD